CRQFGACLRPDDGRATHEGRPGPFDCSRPLDWLHRELRQGSKRRSASYAEDFVDRSFAVSKGIYADAGFVQQGEMQVGQGHWLRIFDITAALHVPCSATGYHDGQVDVIVYVGVPHAASVEVHGM